MEEKVAAQIEKSPALIQLSSADLAFWASMPGWRVSEQAALLHGLNPRASKEDLTSRDDYCRTKARLLRAASMRFLANPAPPKRFIKWAPTNGFDVPPDLERAVSNARRFRRFKFKKSRRSELVKEESDEIKITGRRSVYMMILMMAEKHYGYKHGENDYAVGKITSALRLRFGDALSPESVRNWLRKASKTLGRPKSERSD